MSDTQANAVFTFTGRCLCEAVSSSVKHEKPHVGVCHCSLCRRWGGGPFMSLECHQVPIIEGIEHVSVFASSEWAERGFCMHCGTHLFYRLKESDFYAVSVGLFDEANKWPLTLQVFVDEKPENYDFANETRTMTGEEVFKAFSSAPPTD